MIFLYKFLQSCFEACLEFENDCIRLKFMYEFLQTRELSHCATKTKDLNDTHQNNSIFKIDSFSMCFQTIVTQQT